MAHSQKIKEQAMRFRKAGFSIKEIAEKTGIAKSTASIWLNKIPLSDKAQKRLQQRHILGQYKALQTRRRKKILIEKEMHKKSFMYLKSLRLNKNLNKLLCALLFWAEGAKDSQRMMFINSDPKMITVFLSLFRSSFPVTEKKFRVLMHLHEYHNEKEMKRFWSTVTKIPYSQFTKSYKKPHTKKRKRLNYKGCIRISYHDAYFAKKLHSIYNMFAQNLGA